VNHESLLKQASTTVTECALCGAEYTAVMGCFVPEQGEAEHYWPAKLKRGKTRTLWYGLCSICETLPRRAAAFMVEERMERQARAARQ